MKKHALDNSTPRFGSISVGEIMPLREAGRRTGWQYNPQRIKTAGSVRRLMDAVEKALAATDKVKKAKLKLEWEVAHLQVAGEGRSCR